MTRHILALVFAAMAMPAAAQTAATAIVPASADSLTIEADEATAPPFRFGYVSYDYVLRAMPGYAEAQTSIEKLREKYDAELARAENDFNTKYEEFLEQQRDLPQSILHKRQTELQELLRRNADFRSESQRLLRQAEDETMAPLRQRLNRLIRTVGEQNGYAFILNTDGNSCLFTNSAMADDVTLLVLDQLR